MVAGAGGLGGSIPSPFIDRMEPLHILVIGQTMLMLWVCFEGKSLSMCCAILHFRETRE